MKIMRIISKEKDKIMKQIEFYGKYNRNYAECLTMQ